MCVPVAILGVGLSLAGSAASYGQAQAQYGYQQQISARNAQLARDSANQQYGAIGENLYQSNVETTTETQRIASEALLARSRVGAAAAEAGVSGNSVDALIGDFSRQEGNYISALDTQQRFRETQAHYEKMGVRTGLESRLVNSAPPQAPNLFGQALGAFTNALNTGLSLDSTSYSHGGRTLFI